MVPSSARLTGSRRSSAERHQPPRRHPRSWPERRTLRWREGGHRVNRRQNLHRSADAGSPIRCSERARRASRLTRGSSPELPIQSRRRVGRHSCAATLTTEGSGHSCSGQPSAPAAPTCSLRTTQAGTGPDSAPWRGLGAMRDVELAASSTSRRPSPSQRRRLPLGRASSHPPPQRRRTYPGAACGRVRGRSLSRSLADCVSRSPAAGGQPP
jgi:hypothetical protein